MAFDSRGARTTGYCSNMSSYGCNAWSSTANMVGSPSEFTNGKYTGSVDADSEMLTYLNGEYYNSINGTSQGMIVSTDWNIGGVAGEDNYNGELSLMLEEEKSYKWNGKVALASASDYLDANSNQSMCNSGMLHSTNLETCVTTNWMYIPETYWWLVSPYASYDYAYYEFSVYADGNLNYGANYSRGVRPVVYLTSSLSFSGSGTQSDPFTLS